MVDGLAAEEARKVSRDSAVILRISSDIAHTIPQRLRDRLQDVMQFLAERKEELSGLEPVISEFHYLVTELLKVYTTPSSLLVPIDVGDDIVRNRLVEIMSLLETYIRDIVGKAESTIYESVRAGRFDEQAVRKAVAMIRLSYKLSKLAPIVLLELGNMLIGLVSINAPANARPALARQMSGFDIIEV